MKVCPNCHSKYPDDANFCPQEPCATPEGPRRLSPVPAEPAPRFQLTSRLGGGRSGEVWLARDTQTNDDVAYKLVVPEVLPTPATFERTQRELKQLQRAQNAHLARIVDFGRSADGRLFVATELVSGQTLASLVSASGPLAVDRAKKIVAQIGEALLEGQKVGVVHHDLSAKNVFVGSNDDIKLINFVTPWPVAESVFGVPEYLSPEQAEGKLVDQRSNTYSLGALLLLMLTGKPPFSGANDKAILDQVLHGTLTPPSQLRQGLTPEIDRIVMKAMDKNSSRRPLTMRQFLSEIASMVGMSGAAVAAVPGAPKAGAFAKTMMFAGGAPEVQNLVNQAAAARDAANGSAPPAVAKVVPTPPPAAPAADTAAQAQARRTHGAAIAATMMAMPAAAPGPIPGAAPPAAPKPAAQPAVQMAPPPPAAGGGGGGGGGDGGGGAGGGGSGGGGGGGAGGFRETLWFKKGDVEQMVAEAKAKAAAAAAAKGKPAPAAIDELPAEDAMPIEDRYKDDGSLTIEDRKKFSLRSGATATAMPQVGGSIPGERMSDDEMIGEIGGGKKIAIIAVAVAVLVIVVAIVAISMKGKKKGEGASSEPAAAKAVETAAAPAPVAPVAPAPTPAPAAAVPAPAEPAPAPAAVAAAPKAEAPAKEKANTGPPHKHSAKVASKKKPSSKKHH